MIDLRLGDCLEVMKEIPSKSIDAIICDLPYGTTACKWDIVIPFEPLWEQYKRIIKDNGAIVLFGSQPFTSALVMSNPKLFRYELIWEKGQGSNYALSKKQPLKTHENILVFYKKQPTYNPQMIEKTDAAKKRAKRNHFSNSITSEHDIIKKRRGDCDRLGVSYPRSVNYFKSERNNQYKKSVFHPTQKPLIMIEYLVKTYTNENDLVLDNTMGSGTTMLACQNTNRNGIGIEKDEKYFKIAEQRINSTLF